MGAEAQRSADRAFLFLCGERHSVPARTCLHRYQNTNFRLFSECLPTNQGIVSFGLGLLLTILASTTEDNQLVTITSETIAPRTRTGSSQQHGPRPALMVDTRHIVFCISYFRRSPAPTPQFSLSNLTPSSESEHIRC